MATRETVRAPAGTAGHVRISVLESAPTGPALVACRPEVSDGPSGPRGSGGTDGRRSPGGAGGPAGAGRFAGAGRGRDPLPPWRSASDDGETLYVAQHVHGPIAVPHDGAEVLLEPGDLVFCRPGGPGGPVFPRSGEPYRMTVFHVPRRLLDLRDGELRRVVGVPLRCAEGVGALVSHFLSLVAAETGVHRSPTADRLVGNAAGILAAFVTEVVTEEDSRAPDPGARMTARIREFIEAHLADPALSPATIARAHHLSVRHLHKLFEGEGTTVGQLIRRRRLEACRRELGRSPRRTLTVAAVAHRWGFVSPSHFSRSFRDAYGMSPSQWQRSASSGTGLLVLPPSPRSLTDRTRPAEGPRGRPSGGRRIFAP